MRTLRDELGKGEGEVKTKIDSPQLTSRSRLTLVDEIEYSD